MVGFGTKNIFGVLNSYNHKELQGYFFHNQNLCENGSYRNIPSNMWIANGTTVSIEVNRITNTAMWKIGGSSIA